MFSTVHGFSRVSLTVACWDCIPHWHTRVQYFEPKYNVPVPYTQLLTVNRTSP